jgi:hypothetical protein
MGINLDCHIYAPYKCLCFIRAWHGDVVVISKSANARERWRTHIVVTYDAYQALILAHPFTRSRDSVAPREICINVPSVHKAHYISRVSSSVLTTHAMLYVV